MLNLPALRLASSVIYKYSEEMWLHGRGTILTRLSVGSQVQECLRIGRFDLVSRQVSNGQLRSKRLKDTQRRHYQLQVQHNGNNNY